MAQQTVPEMLRALQRLLLAVPLAPRLSPHRCQAALFCCAAPLQGSFSNRGLPLAVPCCTSSPCKTLPVSAAVMEMPDWKNQCTLLLLECSPKSCAGVKGMRLLVWCWVRALSHRAASHGQQSLEGGRSSHSSLALTTDLSFNTLFLAQMSVAKVCVQPVVLHCAPGACGCRRNVGSTEVGGYRCKGLT